jgi:hypothetical protein
MRAVVNSEFLSSFHSLITTANFACDIHTNYGYSPSELQVLAHLRETTVVHAGRLVAPRVVAPAS